MAAAAVIVGPAGLYLCSAPGGRCKTNANLARVPAFRGTGFGTGSSLMAVETGTRRRTSLKSRSLHVRAAKLPSGVEAPKEEPKLPVSLWGFTEKAEVWNSRAAMIGLFALVALEFVAHRGILQLIGVDVGKGLDLPL